MAKLSWERMNAENLSQRRNLEFPQDFHEPYEKPKEAKFSPQPIKLIDVANPQASCLECKARMRVRSLTKHYRKIHNVTVELKDLNISGSFKRNRVTF